MTPDLLGNARHPVVLAAISQDVQDTLQHYVCLRTPQEEDGFDASLKAQVSLFRVAGSPGWVVSMLALNDTAYARMLSRPGKSTTHDDDMTADLEHTGIPSWHMASWIDFCVQNSTFYPLTSAREKRSQGGLGPVETKSKCWLHSY